MAKIINQLTINGRIGFEPKVSTTAKGRMVTFSLGFYAGKDKENKPQYGNINCISFDEDVVNNIENGGKGCNVMCSGRLQPNTYTKKDGTEVSSLQFVVNNVGME